MTFRAVTSIRRRWADWRYPAGYRVARRGGATWLLNHHHFVDRQMLFNGDYEAAQRDRLFSLSRDVKCRTFLDIGANFGLYSVHAGLGGEFESVHAFEPDNRNLASFNANLKLNGLLGTIFLHEIALSDHNGAVSFQLAGDGFAGKNRVLGKKTNDSKEIEARRLDSVLTPDGPICLKIDVEGHETAVLEGAIGLLEGSQWVVQVEILEEVTAGVSSILADLGGNHAGRIGDDHYFVRG